MLFPQRGKLRKTKQFVQKKNSSLDFKQFSPTKGAWKDLPFIMVRNFTHKGQLVRQEQSKNSPFLANRKTLKPYINNKIKRHRTTSLHPLSRQNGNTSSEWKHEDKRKENFFSREFLEVKKLRKEYKTHRDLILRKSSRKKNEIEKRKKEEEEKEENLDEEQLMISSRKSSKTEKMKKSKLEASIPKKQKKKKNGKKRLETKQKIRDLRILKKLFRGFCADGLEKDNISLNTNSNLLKGIKTDIIPKNSQDYIAEVYKTRQKLYDRKTSFQYKNKTKSQQKRYQAIMRNGYFSNKTFKNMKKKMKKPLNLKIKTEKINLKKRTRNKERSGIVSWNNFENSVKIKVVQTGRRSKEENDIFQQLKTKRYKSYRKKYKEMKALKRNFTMKNRGSSRKRHKKNKNEKDTPTQKNSFVLDIEKRFRRFGNSHISSPVSRSIGRKLKTYKSFNSNQKNMMLNSQDRTNFDGYFGETHGWKSYCDDFDELDIGEV